MTAPTLAGNGGASITPISPWLRKPADDQSEYAPSNFYVKSVDWRGHGERVAVKFPPDIMARIMSMVHEDLMPDYASPQDFIRDAVMHLLELRKDMLSSVAHRQSIEAFLRQMSALEWSLQVEREANHWHTINETMTNALSTLIEDEAFDQATEVLDQYENLAANLAEPYHTKAVAVVIEWRKKIPAREVEE